MLELILVRHAKSDWGDPSLADHDRPLNARGMRDAPLMAERLARTAPNVQRILSSTALRARTTAAAFGEALGLEPELDPELYLASATTLLAKAAASTTTKATATVASTAAQAAPADPESVLVVAHDPGLSELAARLSNGGIMHMPTCAVARCTWTTGDWHETAGRIPDGWRLETPRAAQNEHP